jgi:hypothetical protein
MKRTILGALALIALTSGAAAAQVRPVTLGIAAGASVPMGDANDISETGFHVLGSLSAKPPLFPLGLRADIMYNQLGVKDDLGDPFIEDGDNLRLFSVNLNVLLSGSSPTPLVGFAPYVIGGVGYYNSKLGDFDAENDFGLNGGAGIRFNLGGFSTFGEIRYHYIFVGEDEAGEDFNLSFLPITFGIMF